VANIVLDKQEKCLIMMRMSGLRMSVYWFANWIYQMIVFVLVMVCMYAAGWAFQMRLFTQTSPWLLALVLGLWGNVLISFSFLLSTAFNKAREASIVSYFLVIMGVIVSNLLNGSVFLSENPPFWFLLYPPFAFYRCLFIIVEACVNLQCLDLSSVFGAATGIATQRRLDGILLLLIAQSLFMFFLAWYVAEISPKEWGVRQSPLFCLRPAFRWLSRNKSQRQNEGENDDEEAALLGNGEDYFIAEKKLDEDVMAERRMILGSWDKIATESTLIINELTKTYQNSDRAAVEPICLAIRRGECFGLLGCKSLIIR
jgi:hypothetical protein